MVPKRSVHFFKPLFAVGHSMHCCSCLLPVDAGADPGAAWTPEEDEKLRKVAEAPQQQHVRAGGSQDERRILVVRLWV